MPTDCNNPERGPPPQSSVPKVSRITQYEHSFDWSAIDGNKFFLRGSLHAWNLVLPIQLRETSSRLEKFSVSINNNFQGRYLLYPPKAPHNGPCVPTQSLVPTATPTVLPFLITIPHRDNRRFRHKPSAFPTVSNEPLVSSVQFISNQPSLSPFCRLCPMYHACLRPCPWNHEASMQPSSTT